jgi:hypothetical protein
MENQIFKKIPALQLIICRQCKHAVHPKEVMLHLRTKHMMKPKDIDPIAYAIHQWEDIIQDPSAVNIPHALDDPLPIIDIYTNGMMCQRAPETCQYITTHLNTMRKHWKQAHRWTQTNHHGRVVGAKKAQGEAELQQSF